MKLRSSNLQLLRKEKRVKLMKNKLKPILKGQGEKQVLRPHR